MTNAFLLFAGLLLMAIVLGTTVKQQVRGGNYRGAGAFGVLLGIYLFLAMSVLFVR